MRNAESMVKSWPFWWGAFASALVWGSIAIVDYKRNFDGLCMDCNNDFGFPFRVYRSGGLMQSSEVIWIGVLGNLLLVITSSLAVGYLFHKLFNNPETASR